MPDRTSNSGVLLGLYRLAKGMVLVVALVDWVGFMIGSFIEHWSHQTASHGGRVAVDAGVRIPG